MTETDIRAEYSLRLWALDASLTGGALVRSAISDMQSQELVRVAEKRGGYTKLDGVARSLLRRCACMKKTFAILSHLGNTLRVRWRCTKSSWKFSGALTLLRMPF